MKIGSYGDIVFQVSPKKTQTFDSFERSGSARWNDHEIIGMKPKSEFNGPGLEEISLTILFKAELGVNPIKQIEKLRKMRDTGKAAPFVLGGKPISKNYWVIPQFSESHKIIDNKGNLLQAEINLSLKEYVVKKKKQSSKPKAKFSTSSVTSKKKSIGKMEITVQSVNIRSGPSTSNRVIGYAYKGDKLTVYSLKNGWYSLGQGKYISANSDYSNLKKG